MNAELKSLLEAARAERRTHLTEVEALALVSALGVTVPTHRLVKNARQIETLDLSAFRSERLVVKVVSHEILHKSDSGGVEVVPKRQADLVAAIEAMERRQGGRAIAGYSLNEYVAHDTSFGGELLLGVRWTADFGPVVAFGPGGIYAEHLATHLRPGSGIAILSPYLHGLTADARGQTAPIPLERLLATKAVTPAVTGGLRGRRPSLEPAVLQRLLETFLEFADTAMPSDIAELEINPLVCHDGKAVALDALVRLAPPNRDGEPSALPRPLEKVDHLLTPRSIAVLGVSKRLNPGRVILRNILRSGFSRDRVIVVKPGTETIEGCRCVDDLGDLPHRVDLAVLAIDAAQIPRTVDRLLELRRAESLILIPGGLGERRGSEERAERLRSSLADARRSGWRGPLINGGNCLGVRSQPGRYDTLFIPESKLRFPAGPETPLALISQSGAFAIARASKLSTLNPRYLITVGNQVDLTVGDYLTYLKDDSKIEVFACYVEGFRPLDGRRFLEAASEITRGGRPVILYRAGRTAAGAKATASHTASIAGDYATTRELARAAGVVVAESLADFEDLVHLFCCLRRKTVAGWRLGAVSNAGFECVAIADNTPGGQLEPGLRLAAFSPSTHERLSTILDRARVGSIVSVSNPLDVTPMLADADYEAASRAVLEDGGVDIGCLGCVPLTGALETLSDEPGHGEDLNRETSVVRRLVRLAEDQPKACVTVVDSGALYDPMAHLLIRKQIPTFRTADRALRLFEAFCRWRITYGKQ